MKETHYHREVLFFIGMLFFAACQPEEEYVQEGINEDIIDKAKEWYNSAIKTDIQFCSTRAASGMPVKPEWSYLSYEENSKYRVLEVGLISEFTFCFIDPSSLAKYKETGDERYKLSKTCFVFRINKATNEMDAFLMTITPTTKYLEDTGFSPFKRNSYLSRDSEFSGYIFYHNLKGNYVNGWKYTDGIICNSIYVTDGLNPVELRPQTKAPPGYICRDEYLEYLITECWMWGLPNGEITGMDCREYYEWEYYMTLCEPVDDSGDYEDPPTSGGNPPTTGESPGSNLLKLIPETRILIDSEGVKIINDQLGYLLDQSTFSKLYDWGTNTLHAQFNGMKYNPNRRVGAYDPKTGFFEVKSNDEISSSLEEEIIHMFQDYIYGGIENCAIPNIEFEAKLFRDIGEAIGRNENTVGGYGEYLNGENPKGKLSNEYPLWINHLTNYGTKFPTYDEIKAPFNGHDYWEFMYDFKGKDSDYNKNIDHTLEPEIFINFNY